MVESTKPDNIDRLFTNLSSIPDEPKTYIYNPPFPLGKVTGIAGDPGVGKSKAIYAITGKVTKGEPLLDMQCEKPGEVILITTEDDASDIKQTIASCGGDLSKVHVLSERDDALNDLAKCELTFASPIIESAIKKFHPVMVVFDPLQAYLGQHVDPNKAVQVTTALKPLISLAKRYNFAAVVIQHNNKMADASLQNRAAGSASIVGCYRSLLSIVRDPENPKENIAIHTKSNNAFGKSIRYRIKPIEGNENFATVEFIRLENYTERDYQAALKRKKQSAHDDEINDSDAIVATIIRLLEDNPRGLRISRMDLQNAVSSYYGEPMHQGLKDIEREYASFLLSKHGICIQCKSAQDLKTFYIKGKPVTLLKPHDKCLHIYKRGTPVQTEI